MSSRLSELTNLTDPADADEFEIRDDSDTPNNDVQNKAITYKILKGISSWKQPVRIATDAAGTLATSFENGDTIDGVVLSTGDRLLIKDQATGAENGIYIVNVTGAPTRATDFDTDLKAISGIMVPIEEGTVNQNKVFQLTTDNAITIGTTALVFVEFGAGGGGGFSTVVKSADEDLLNDNTPNPDTDLQFNVDANGKYIIMAFIYFTRPTGGTFSFKWKFSIPSGTIFRNSNLWTYTNISIVDATAEVNNSQNSSLYMNMVILHAAIGGSGGILTFDWAQSTADAVNPQRVLQKSTIMFKKLN